MNIKSIIAAAFDSFAGAADAAGYVFVQTAESADMHSRDHSSMLLAKGSHAPKSNQIGMTEMMNKSMISTSGKADLDFILGSIPRIIEAEFKPSEI